MKLEHLLEMSTLLIPIAPKYARAENERSFENLEGSWL